MESPVGMMALPEAVELVRTRLDDPERAIAERCTEGEIAAFYRDSRSVTELDRGVWLRPQWRDYFDAGKIGIDYHYADHASPTGECGYAFTAMCEIFVKAKDVRAFVDTLPPPVAASPRRATLKAYIEHQMSAKAATGAYASRDDDLKWAKDNNYTQLHARDELRDQFKKTLNEAERAAFEKSGRRPK